MARRSRARQSVAERSRTKQRPFGAKPILPSEGSASLLRGQELMLPTAEKLGSADPVNLFPAEAPAYPALQRAVGSVWREVRSALVQLRSAWFDTLNIQDPQKRESEPLSAAQRRALDSATERFLRQMAGEDRSLAGFASQSDEDGLIQQAVYLANRVGMGRASEATGHVPRNPALSTAQRERLARDSFQRLSKDGKLRFEGRLSDIRSRMDEAFRLGENPLKVARELASAFDLEASRLRALARTEMGIAAIEGQRDLYQEAGIRQVEVIGDPTTDELCTAHIGRQYSVSDSVNMPPFHPNCFCDLLAVT